MENETHQNQQVPLETNEPVAPVAGSGETGTNEDTGSSVGAIVAICIIIAIIVVGALYAWGARLEKEASLDSGAESSLEAQYQEEIMREDSASNDLRTQSNSTDISSIEADLESTDFSSIEADIEALNAEFE